MFPATPAEPEVVRAMRAFKAELLALETEQMREMARRWLAIERSLQGRMDALALEIHALRAQGDAVPAARLFRLERYRILLAEARVEVTAYMDAAADLIERQQRSWGDLGVQQARAAILTSQVENGLIAGQFDRLPVSAIENMVGLVGDGTPLDRYLQSNALPGALDGLSRSLVDAVALGINPRETARRMASGLAGGLNSALNTARTEQLRVYREAARQQYVLSGVVRGYKRLSARDDRVCIACLVADGRFYELDQAFEEHNCGRCTLVPVVEGLPEISWQSGAAWFEAQDEATQRRIMGAGRFDAWQSGAFDLQDVVTLHEDPVWGNALMPTPLKDLVAGEVK